MSDEIEGIRPRRILRKFRLGEISAVDVPAQEGALIGLVKSKEDRRMADEKTTEAQMKALEQRLEAAEAARKAAEVEAAEAREAAGAKADAEAKALRDELAAERKARLDESLRNRVEREFSALPGTVEQKMAVVRALDGIEDAETRDAGFRMLKSSIPTLTEVTKSVDAGKGSDNNDEIGTKEQAAAAIETAVKARIKAAKDAGGEVKTYAKEYDAFLSTREGAKLYHLYNTLPAAQAV
jgi:hypothetical protein